MPRTTAERRQAKAVSMRAAGVAPAEIAAELSVTCATVSRYLGGKDPGYLIECENCGDLGFVIPSHARFCSKDCKDVAGHRRRRASASERTQGC